METFNTTGIHWSTVIEISKIPPVQHHDSLKEICFHDFNSNGIAYIVTKVEKYAKRAHEE